MGCSQGSLRVAKLVSNDECQSLVSGRDTTIFVIFQKFPENSNYEIIYEKLNFPTL